MVKYTEQENQIPVTTALMDGIIEIEFTKADGTLRKMKATLQESIVPHTDRRVDKKPNTEACVVWDTEIQQWRSFRWDRLQTVKETS